MCKKLMFLISFVLLLGMVGSASAVTRNWTDAYPWSNLWISPQNWDPAGVPGADDTAYINPDLCSPGWLAPVIDANVTVGNINGPRYDSDDDQVMYILAGVVKVNGTWRTGDDGTGNSTIDISGNSNVTVGSLRGPTNGTADVIIRDNAVLSVGSWQDAFNSDSTGGTITVTDSALLTMTGDTTEISDDDENADVTIVIEKNASLISPKRFYAGDAMGAHISLTVKDNGFLKLQDRNQIQSPADIVFTDDAVIQYSSRFRQMKGGTMLINGNASVAGSGYLQFSDEGGTTTYVTITDDARVVITDRIQIGDDGSAEMTISGNAYVSCTSGLRWPDSGGLGRLFMSGNPTVMVRGDEGFALPRNNDATEALCHLYGGTMDTDKFTHDGSSNWSMDVEAGVMIINGDQVAVLQGNVADGQITAYHERGDIHIDYNNVNPTRTTLWAEPQFERAWNPSPTNGATDVASHGTCLSWSPGDSAIAHHLWFSDDLACVTYRNISCYIGELPAVETSYCLPPLELCKTYYWVVDEESLGAVITPGLVWSFTVECSYAVEDFEEYTLNPHYIYDVWMDGAGDVNGVGGNGTGSWVELAMDYVHSGAKAMSYIYDNTGLRRDSNYSEATRSFDPAQDWTSSDEAALVIWFRGNSDNASSAMWVLLNGNVGAMATYGDNGDDPEDVKKAEWIEWNISLASLGDVSSITSMSIGFGDNIGDVPGGEGLVYFDDISLYPVRCVPKYTPALQGADYNSDCVVDGKDLKLFCAGWLKDNR